MAQPAKSDARELYFRQINHPANGTAADASCKSLAIQRIDVCRNAGYPRQMNSKVFAFIAGMVLGVLIAAAGFLAGSKTARNPSTAEGPRLVPFSGGKNSGAW